MPASCAAAICSRCPPRWSTPAAGNVAMLQSLGLDTSFLDAGELSGGRAGALARGSRRRGVRAGRRASPTRRRCASAGSLPLRRRGLRHHLGRNGGGHPGRGRPRRRRRDGGRLRPGRPGRAGRRCLGERPPAPARRRAADRAAPAAGAGRPDGSRRPASLRGLLGRGVERRRPARPGPAVLRRRLRRRGPARARGRLRPRALGRLRGRRSRSACERGIRGWPDFELVRGFAGPYDITPDWNPIIGPCPGIDGLYLAVGWSGHGFKLSPAVGEVVAAEVTGRTPPIDVERARGPSASRRAGCSRSPTARARA